MYTSLKWKEGKNFEKKETKQIWLHKLVRQILSCDLFSYISYIQYGERWLLVLLILMELFTLLPLTFMSCNLFSSDFYLPVYAYRHLFDLTNIDQICTLHRDIQWGYHDECHVLTMGILHSKAQNLTPVVCWEFVLHVWLWNIV